MKKRKDRLISLYLEPELLLAIQEFNLYFDSSAIDTELSNKYRLANWVRTAFEFFCRKSLEGHVNQDKIDSSFASGDICRLFTSLISSKSERDCGILLGGSA